MSVRIRLIGLLFASTLVSSAAQAASFNMTCLGKELGGWDDKGKKAAKYASSGSNYRTWKPTVSEMPDGGLFISTKLDHLRTPFQLDDHAQLEMTFDKKGVVTKSNVRMHIRGKPELAGEIAEAAKDVPQPKVKVIAEVADKLIGPIQKSVRSLGETGGRVNFPAVVKHNMFRIDECVKP